MSNPYSVYKANYINNLPLGVTYNSTISRFFYNGKSFLSPQAVESYRLYLNKVFDPLSFDPLVLWDFSEGTVFQDVDGNTPATEHGDPVGLVLDRSNSNNLRQPVDSVRPTLDIVNGVRGIRFNGTDQFLDATGLTADSGPKTVIAGCITDGGEGGANEFLFDARVGRLLSAAVGSSSGEAGMYDGSWTSGGDYNAEALSVLTFRHYATGGGIRANGVEVLTENVVEKPFGGSVTVGANFSVSGGFLDGVVHTMMIEDRALSDREIQLYESFVAHKQGRSL